MEHDRSGGRVHNSVWWYWSLTSDAFSFCWWFSNGYTLSGHNPAAICHICFSERNCPVICYKSISGFLDNKQYCITWMTTMQSRSLSHIEHLHAWCVTDRRVLHRQNPSNRDKLTLAVTEEWNNIPLRTVKRLIKSMHKRILKTSTASGGHTQYQSHISSTEFWHRTALQWMCLCFCQMSHCPRIYCE